MYIIYRIPTVFTHNLAVLFGKELYDANLGTYFCMAPEALTTVTSHSACYEFMMKWYLGFYFIVYNINI